MKIAAILSLVSVVTAYIPGPGGIDLGPYFEKAKCALPCIVAAMHVTKCHRPGEPLVHAFCDRGNRYRATRSSDSCLERKCNLGGISPIINLGIGFACKHPGLLGPGKHPLMRLSRRQSNTTTTTTCADCTKDCNQEGCEDDGSCEFCLAVCNVFCEE